MAKSDAIQKAPEKTQLPTMLELYDEKSIEKWEKDNALHVLLNQPANPKWLQPHPYAKRKVRQEDGSTKDAPAMYLPIARQEWLMTRIFINWYPEVLDVKLIANSVAVTLRVHYMNPTDGKWQWVDGVGAVPLQTDQGAGATDFMKLKSSSVQMALPAAKSYAFKDAVETLGNIFGKDVNRLDPINYDPMLATFSKTVDPLKQMMAKIRKGLAVYQGADKTTLQEECQRKYDEGEFSEIYANFVAKKIGVTL